jgi:tRNA-2-methylthio-N6-dimethylallyladenosine synthase
MVRVKVTYAAPHHLVADGPMLALRRTRAGDAWEARESAACGTGSTPGTAGTVSLGMPSLRRA